MIILGDCTWFKIAWGESFVVFFFCFSTCHLKTKWILRKTPSLSIVSAKFVCLARVGSHNGSSDNAFLQTRFFRVIFFYGINHIITILKHNGIW